MAEYDCYYTMLSVADMPGYWWECESCGEKSDFPSTVGVTSMSSFVWDKLIRADWDQSLLVSPCPHCASVSCRITYESPRTAKVTLRVVHIVGRQSDDYVPMMWETYPTDSPADHWFDFKYQRGRNPWGLNKAAVFSRQELHELFVLYRRKTGTTEFP